MKISLNQHLSQTLTITPQLQQAIRLLQLSALDLQTEIQQTLDANFMLEQVDGTQADADYDDYGSDEGGATREEPDAGSGDTRSETPDAELGGLSDIPDDLHQVDTSWDDVYESGEGPVPGYQYNSEESDPGAITGGAVSLREHLIGQLRLMPLSARDHAIGTAIIDSIDDDGYLGTPLPDLAESLSSEHDPVGVDEVGTVLQWVQNLDPVGIGARDLRECLLLQLKHRGPQTPHYDVAWRLVDLYLDLLASHENESLLTLLDVDAQKLSDAVRLVRTLEPRPGRSIDLRPAEYVVPDVVVRRLGGHWAVELNREALPNLRINPSYAALVRRADASETNTCLRNHLQEARWFLKSLASRNETLLKVATSIVRHQQEFLDAGDKAMKPLVLREIADEVELHESTVSRVTNRKYMHTPRGVFEFKFFFSRHLGDEGEDCSSTAIRAIIRKLVDEEPPRRPLSDSQLTRRIAEQGMHIARRTVAKYREAMNIPSSTDRKRMI